jgi:hypothetical protein
MPKPTPLQIPPDIYAQMMEVIQQSRITQEEIIARAAAETTAQITAQNERWQTEMAKQLATQEAARDAALAKQAAELKVQLAEQAAARDAVLAQQAAEWKAQQKKNARDFNKQFARIGDRIGEIVATMFAADIVGKFKKLGYKFTLCAREIEFSNAELDISGEIDFFLENGVDALLGEVKTTLKTEDVKEHLERMEKYRRYADFRGDSRHFLAAVAGAVIKDGARNLAHKNGMFVIAQSGEAVKILTPPPGFEPQRW